MDQPHQGEIAVSPTPTPRFNHTIARATRLAQETGHAYVGTEHLLLALLDDESGIAGQVLNRENQGERIRQTLDAILADPAYHAPTRRIY